ncbi:MAG: D-alanyl-D-alanine carboxypeptidase, partial [Pseudomonadota bacterium]
YEFDGLVPVAYAKTGTLRDVKSMAGFIESPLGTYQFAFIFNRQTSWKYREKILQQLAQTIHLETISAAQN